MKLYNFVGPNPWRVRAYLMEMGAEVPLVEVNALEGASRTPEFLKINSLGELPVLELDDGRRLTESIAICRYLDTLFDGSELFGTDAYDQALVEMWNRRMEQQIVGAVGGIAMHTFEFFAEKIEQIPDYAESQRRALDKKWRWLDGELSDGRAFVAGENFSVADITGMMGLRVCGFVEAVVPDDCAHV